MTGDKMKSDCTMDSRYRSEGRPSLPRRRVATKTAHENGDFEMELSLAIKESLKYAKEKEGQLKGVDKTSPLLNGVKTDESFTQMAGKMLTFATSNDQGQGSEVQQLKDLLLIHIELIQHQQEQLANKDKEIRLLRNEKDTLQGRLLKAEKKCAVLKQKEECLEAQVASSRNAVIAHETASAPESIPKAEQPSARKRKKQQQQTRKGRPKKQKKVRKPVVDKTSDSVSSGEEEEEEEDSEEEDDDDDDREREEGSDIDEDEEEEEEEAETEEMVLSEKGNVEVKQEEEPLKDPHPDPVLRTECLYHVACAVDLPPEEPVELNDEKEVITGEEVETPGWRINVLKNIYQLEGTENITDEAYQKRHQKHEVEEKRRKRWDIQRMREQKVFEKLKGKEEVCCGNQSQAEVTLNTFLPCLDDLTHVEVAENVCVMAFGQAIPHVEPYEFELPWDTGPSSSYTRKSHGGRGRQK